MVLNIVTNKYNEYENYRITYWSQDTKLARY